MTDLTALTLAEARDGLKAKKFSATELTQGPSRRDRGRQPALNAYVLVTPELALEQAEGKRRAARQGRCASARRPAARQQGSLLHQGRAHHRVLEDPRRFQADL